MLPCTHHPDASIGKCHCHIEGRLGFEHNCRHWGWGVLVGGWEYFIPYHPSIPLHPCATQKTYAPNCAPLKKVGGRTDVSVRCILTIASRKASPRWSNFNQPNTFHVVIPYRSRVIQHMNAVVPWYPQSVG